jgi:hypothetical protein
MANPSGAKGYRGEQPVVEYLKSFGFFRAYRPGKQGTNDKGDVHGIDGVAIEIKNHGVYKFPEWMKELVKEKRNAAAETSALVVKPRGIGETRVKDWWVVMTLEEYAQLLEAAGYGPFGYSEHEESRDGVGSEHEEPGHGRAAGPVRDHPRRRQQ